jgi:rubrerythrin
METKEIAEKLSLLLRYDIDAVRAYEQAERAADHPGVRARFGEFRSDHQRHVNLLSAFVRRCGMEPASLEGEGFTSEGFQFVDGTGTEPALRAMRENEIITNRVYEEALSWSFPPDVLETIQRSLQDEREHLDYIEHTIREMSTEREVA